MIVCNKDHNHNTFSCEGNNRTWCTTYKY